MLQRNGTQVWSPVRQGGVHRVQARTAQPVREHRSPQARGVRQQGGCQVCSCANLSCQLDFVQILFIKGQSDERLFLMDECSISLGDTRYALRISKIVILTQ